MDDLEFTGFRRVNLMMEALLDEMREAVAEATAPEQREGPIDRRRDERRHEPDRRLSD